MSDNLLLTVLGAVGIGALVMGLKENDNQIKEEFVQGYSFNRKMEKEIGNECSRTAVNFATNPSLQQSIQTISKLNKEGVPQAQQIAHLQNQSMNRVASQKANIQKAMAPVESFSTLKEGFSYPSQNLGSSAVTRNDYVSYPQFNQSTPLQSPSLNLPAQIRYNPPSLNNMGITNAYQNQPMDYAGVVEGYTSVNTYEKNPQLMSTGFNNNVTETNPSSFLGALNNGTKSYANNKDSPVQGGIPMSDMDSGAMNNKNANNIMMFDRAIYSTGKGGGWRAHSRGDTDHIRGDLAVCVDPCQKGWFQSSLKPTDLVGGAMNVLMGENNNTTTQAMARQYGSLSASNGSQGQTATLTTLQKALLGNSSNGTLNSIASVTSFS